MHDAVPTALDNSVELWAAPEQQMFPISAPNEPISQPMVSQQPLPGPEANQQPNNQPEPSQQFPGMVILEATPEELEQWAQELQHDINNQGHAPEMPVQQAAGDVPQQPPSQDELMAFREQLMNGQAPPQEIAPAPGQQVDIDPLAWLELSPENIMSEEELRAHAASQGFHIEGFGEDGLDAFNGVVIQQEGNGSSQAMNDEAMNDNSAEKQPVQTNEEQLISDNQQQEQENRAVEEQNFFDQFVNFPDEINNIENEDHDEGVNDDDLFADEYVENHGIEGIDSQDSTGTGSTGNKRKRDDVDEGDDGKRPSQRARLD